jgi:hypothetical protein
MTVIVMAQQMGSLGTEIAQTLAQRMGLRHVRYRLAAECEPGPEVAHALLRKVVDDHASLRSGRIPRDQPRRRVALTEVEIIENAMGGRAVLEGFGAELVLRSVPEVVSIRIRAPLPLRIERTIARLGLAQRSKAECLIAMADAASAAAAAQMLGTEEQEAIHYDAVLDTARLGIEDCVEQICHLASRPSRRPRRATQLALEALHLEARARVAARFMTLDMACSTTDGQEYAPRPRRRPRV